MRHALVTTRHSRVTAVVLALAVIAVALGAFGALQRANAATTLPLGLRSVTFADANHGWMASDNGQIWATADGGATWTQRTLAWPATSTSAFGPISAADASHVVALESVPKDIYGNVAFRTADGGLTWPWARVAPTVYADARLQDVVLADASTGWAVGYIRGDLGVILKTQDGGATWNEDFRAFYTPASGEDTLEDWALGDVVGVDVTPSGLPVAVGYRLQPFTLPTKQVLPASSYSLTRTSLGLPAAYTSADFPYAYIRARDVACASNTLFFAVGTGGDTKGYVCRSVNAGVSWTRNFIAVPPSGQLAGLLSVASANASVTVAVGEDGTIERTGDGGTTWIRPASGVTWNLRNVTYAGGTRFIAVGDGGTVLRSDNLGVTWSNPVTSPVTPPPANIATKLTIAKSATTLAYGTPVTLSGTLKTTGGVGVGDAAVRIDYRYQGSSSWLALRTLRTVSGAFSTTDTRAYNAEYRVSFLGGSGYSSATTVYAGAVNRAVYLSTPSESGTVYHAKYKTWSGYLKPRHTVGAYDVKLYFYRKEGTRYVLRRTATARNYAYVVGGVTSTVTNRYSVSVSLPYAGTWRVRAYHAADTSGGARHLATSSSYRYFTVK